VKIDDNRKKYFQSIAIDSTQLSSSVIRAFKKEYKLEDSPALGEIIKGEVQFYAHCSTKLGVKLDFWQKVGNVTDVGKLDHIIFRDTMDYGRKLGEEPVSVVCQIVCQKAKKSGQI
jgi:Ca2+-binding EF-hand superfamily protein